MSKMCSLSRAMRSTDGEAYVNLMSNPKYYCKRCGRVANEREYLCRPYPLVEENKNETKIKEVEIAVTRDGLHKHYVIEKSVEDNKVKEKCDCNDEKIEHQCNCSPEDNCGDDCSCKENVVHVSDLFKNEDGSFSDEWVLDEDSDEIPLKEEDDEPFIKSLIHEIDKKDKKIKKMRMSELRAIIRSEIKKILDEK
mgnify:FL=1